jgi:hypothetical protein
MKDIGGRKGEASCKVHCKWLLVHSLLQASFKGVQDQVADSRIAILLMAAPKCILNLLTPPKVRRGQNLQIENRGQPLHPRRTRKRMDVQAAATVGESKDHQHT